jgi:hypothetical protein
VSVLCPECGGDSVVRDSRQIAKTHRRRRECLSCRQRFTTYEIPSTAMAVFLELQRLSGVLDTLRGNLASLGATTDAIIEDLNLQDDPSLHQLPTLRPRKAA